MMHNCTILLLAKVIEIDKARDFSVDVCANFHPSSQQIYQKNYCTKRGNIKFLLFLMIEASIYLDIWPFLPVHLLFGHSPLSLRANCTRMMDKLRKWFNGPRLWLKVSHDQVLPWSVTARSFLKRQIKGYSHQFPKKKQKQKYKKKNKKKHSNRKWIRTLHEWEN